MSQPRWISPLLCLAIFFANACCLYHAKAAQHQTSAKPQAQKHACCKKSTDQQDKTPSPKKECACCERSVATAAQVSNHLQTLSHFALDTFAIANQSIQPTILLSHTGSIVGLSPAAGSLDVLHQSCTLIL